MSNEEIDAMPPGWEKARARQSADEARRNATYRKEPWGKLAERAGFNPYRTESSARSAFDFCAGEIEVLQAQVRAAAGLRQALLAISGAAPWPDPEKGYVDLAREAVEAFDKAT